MLMLLMKRLWFDSHKIIFEYPGVLELMPCRIVANSRIDRLAQIEPSEKAEIEVIHLFLFSTKHMPPEHFFF